MEKTLLDKIEHLLGEGKTKDQVWRNLKETENQEELVFLLNDLPTLKNRRAFLLLNLPLCALLVIMTGMKLFAAVAIGQINYLFFLAMVVPMINVYLLKKILRFRRTGFLYLFVLSFLSLFQPENHRLLEVVLLGVILFLSGFLYLKMFPKKERLKSPEKAPTNG
ncbi:MAG: hypothetical protein KKG47_10575 [Proteobacteria bacterium]|nr:hypothetical protein [Pseudomonadota bacterium]MBU1737578.1 hypothetical protein [Pseudomonadota bacterium]